jgi:hypothetical protein
MPCCSPRDSFPTCDHEIVISTQKLNTARRIDKIVAWLWESWEEYVERCQPVGIRSGSFNLGHTSTWLESTRLLLESVEDLRKASQALAGLGFQGQNSALPKFEAALVGSAREQVINAVYAGETLLLYHKRLALSELASSFLYENDLLDHWERYATGPGIVHEVREFAEAVSELLEGYERLRREDELLLLDDLDLPQALEEDFRLSRDLFSLGFDEVGLFVAARGLEKVLRRIANDRKITLTFGKNSVSASEANLHDLIEGMAQVRWKVKGTHLLSKETKTLLQYIRTVRNSGAHSGSSDLETENLRHTASIIARAAQRLWNASSNRAKLLTLIIPKTWNQ